MVRDRPPVPRQAGLVRTVTDIPSGATTPQPRDRARLKSVGRVPAGTEAVFSRRSVRNGVHRRADSGKMKTAFRIAKR